MDNLEINQNQEQEISTEMNTEVITENKPTVITAKNSKLPLILSCLSMIIAISVSVLYFVGKNKSCNNNTGYKKFVVNDSLSNGLNIAYIDMAYYLSEYKYAVKLQEDYKTEQKKEEANFEYRKNQFMKKVSDFYEKQKFGSFLSEKSMEEQLDNLAKEEQSLQKLQEELQRKFMEKGSAGE